MKLHKRDLSLVVGTWRQVIIWEEGEGVGMEVYPDTVGLEGGESECPSIPCEKTRARTCVQ